MISRPAIAVATRAGGPQESFSQVIKRAHWYAPPSTAAALLHALESSPPLDDAVLDDLDRAQKEDTATSSAWTESPSTPPS